MKSFWIGTIAAVFVAVIAGIALENTDQSAEARFSTENVRL